jgi:hypothetical protein
MIQNLPPVTRAILILLAGSLVFSALAPTLAMTVLPLYPRGVFGGQIWRLLSYPLFYFSPGAGVVGNLMKLLWTGMLILFFGGELETILHSRRVGWAVGIVTLLGGVVFSLLSPDGVLIGPSIVTMFLLGGFAYMWPTRQIAIFGIFWIKSWIVAVAVLALYIIPLRDFNLDVSASNVFGPIFGTVAAVVYFHVVYRQYSFGRAFLSRFDRSAKAEKRTLDDSSPHEVERKIDEILDKISKGGVSSLSKAEKDFLLKHSENK